MSREDVNEFAKTFYVQPERGVVQIEPALLQDDEKMAASKLRTHDDLATPLPETLVQEVSKRPTRRRSLLVVVSLLLLVSAGILQLLSLLSQPVAEPLTIPAHSMPTVGSVGQLSFTSSGQLDPTSATGLNDRVLINLTGLIPPSQGMNYYAWLQSGQYGIAPLLLSKLSVIGGNAQIFYQDKRHANLLASYSRLLITQQSASSIPIMPSPDPKTWRYQAAIPDIPTPGDENGYSLLSHIRHLLAKDPTLNQIGLAGGLDIWLYRNIGKILEWSNAARDDWAGSDVDLTRRQIDRVVQYLDGQVYAFRDLPLGTPWLVDPKAGRPGIIDFTTAQDEQGPPSYLSHVRLHLMGVVNAPGHTTAQQQLARHINAALTHIETLLKNVRSDAVQLAKMSDEQMKQQPALALLDDLQMNANTAYTGQMNPAGGGGDGEALVHAQMQALASMSITTFLAIQATG